jgi:hypothetical protein
LYACSRRGSLLATRLVPSGMVYQLAVIAIEMIFKLKLLPEVASMIALET